MYESISKAAQFKNHDEASKWGEDYMDFLKKDGYTITNFSMHGQYQYDRKGNVKKDSQYYQVSVSAKKGEMIKQYDDYGYDDID